MNKSVLLIQPFRKPSLREVIIKNYPCWEIINTNPLTIGAILEKEGLEVDFLNLQNIFKSYEDNDIGKLEELLNGYMPDYLIFHTDYYIAFTSTAVFYSIKMITKFYKEKNRDVKSILIGRNGLALGRKVFEEDSNIDIVVKGECEEILLDILKGIEQGRLDQVPCILYKEKNKIIENAGCGKIKNMDKLPVPAFHLLNDTAEQIEKITGLKVGKLPISIRTSFGCPMNCKYCGGISTWNEYHIKTKEYLEKEIDYFMEVFGEKGDLLFFADELFSYNEEHIKNVVNIFKERNLKVGGLFVHSGFFTDKIAKEIKNISDTVVFGAENCCDAILRLANKAQTFESLMRSVEIAKTNDLKVSLEWIVGLPGETKETAIKNINMIYSLIVKKKVDNINTYVYCPYPNTEFELNSWKYGMKIHDSIDEMLEEGFPTYSLENLTSNQIYVYYLMTQLVIKMAFADRDELSDSFLPSESNFDRMGEIFDRIGENRTC